jgi:apolipoprotein N-acyltransferase
VSDNRGRVLAEQSSAAPFATLIASAPVRHDDTPYARFGDWFAWLNLASVAMILVSLGFKRTTSGS